jgi:TonB family protein
MIFWYRPMHSLHEDTVSQQNGETMLLNPRIRFIAIACLLWSGWAATGVRTAWGQVEIDRAVKVRISPVYPELARKMKIVGVVRVEVTVSPNGSVKSAKLVGGHPVLANAALDAVKRWRFETAAAESTGVVQFRFDPQE